MKFWKYDVIKKFSEDDQFDEAINYEIESPTLHDNKQLNCRGNLEQHLFLPVSFLMDQIVIIINK